MCYVTTDSINQILYSSEHSNHSTTLLTLAGVDLSACQLQIAIQIVQVNFLVTKYGITEIPSAGKLTDSL